MVILLLTGGCGGGHSGGGSDVITIDTRNSYPEKELILQDFMTVEYVVLETSDDFLCDGRVLDIGEDIILAGNNNPDGDIFVFDRNGRGMRKINRRGRGGDEYLSLAGVVLDEENGEIFINDNIGRKILVYDLFGAFKRILQYDGVDIYGNIYNFDKENLIFDIGFDATTSDKTQCFIMSKQGGGIVHGIQIPYEQKKSTKIDGNGGLFMIYPYRPVLSSLNRWILSEASSDTIYCFSPNYGLTPFIARTPSIQSMNPEVFLFPKIVTDRYCFMEKVKKEKSFTRTGLVYDRQENAVYEYSLYNKDYSNGQRVNAVTLEPLNNGKIVFWQKIEAYELVDSYKNRGLNGRLSEIAAQLDETSNPVILLAKDIKQNQTNAKLLN